MQWRCRHRLIDLTRPVVMGILNVTPDSFSDGNRYSSVDAALQRAKLIAAEGAAIIDVGGESTRPGAAAVEEAVEIARVVPVIEGIAAASDIAISGARAGCVHRGRYRSRGDRARSGDWFRQGVGA